MTVRARQFPREWSRASSDLTEVSVLRLFYSPEWLWTTKGLTSSMTFLGSSD